MKCYITICCTCEVPLAFINEEVYNGLTLDDERIRQAIIEFRPRLVVIDPIQAYLGSDSDLQIAGRARKLMHRLGMWAAGYDCAIVLIGAVTEKKKILEEEFGVAMNEELEGEVLVMCNLSQGVKAEGISIGEMRMLVKQVRKGRVTIEEAAEDAGMTVEEFKKILENTPL